MAWTPHQPKRRMPSLPSNLASACDARYIYSCQQCGLSISDLQVLSYTQVQDVLELNAFYVDAAENYEDDEKARAAESQFWS